MKTVRIIRCNSFDSSNGSYFNCKTQTRDQRNSFFPTEQKHLSCLPFSSKPLKSIRIVTFPGNPGGMNISRRPRPYTRCATNRDFNLIYESVGINIPLNETVYSNHGRRTTRLLIRHNAVENLSRKSPSFLAEDLLA